MISNELSMVQRNSAESSRIAAAMDEFLSRGGQIQQGKTFGYVPRTVLYGSFAPPGKGIERARPAMSPRDVAKAAIVATLRTLAETMTKTEASRSSGINISKVERIAIEYGLAFRLAARGGDLNLQPYVKDVSDDASKVERIKAMRDIGVNRNQAARQMGISPTLMRRLIADYSIDFPVLDRSSAGRLRRQSEQG